MRGAFTALEFPRFFQNTRGRVPTNPGHIPGIPWAASHKFHRNTTRRRNKDRSNGSPLSPTWKLSDRPPRRHCHRRAWQEYLSGLLFPTFPCPRHRHTRSYPRCSRHHTGDRLFRGRPSCPVINCNTFVTDRAEKSRDAAVLPRVAGMNRAEAFLQKEIPGTGRIPVCHKESGPRRARPISVISFWLLQPVSLLQPLFSPAPSRALPRPCRSLRPSTLRPGQTAGLSWRLS